MYHLHNGSHFSIVWLVSQHKKRLRWRSALPLWETSLLSLLNVPLGRIKDFLYSFYPCSLGWLLSAPIPVTDETLMTAILPVGIPVGCELFSAAFAGETIDRFWALPDLVTVLTPPFSSAGFTAETSLPACLRLHQKLTAAWTEILSLYTGYSTAQPHDDHSGH